MVCQYINSGLRFFCEDVLMAGCCVELKTFDVWGVVGIVVFISNRPNGALVVFPNVENVVFVVVVYICVGGIELSVVKNNQYFVVALKFA